MTMMLVATKGVAVGTTEDLGRKFWVQDAQRGVEFAVGPGIGAKIPLLIS